MKALLRFRLIPAVALVLVTAGCASDKASVESSDAGYRAMTAGDFAKSRDIFAPLLAQNPHDPLIELNLGVSYQNLGRMDLAEPLYRSVLVDGKGFVPATTQNAGDSKRTLADIACQNLRIGLNNPQAC